MLCQMFSDLSSLPLKVSCGVLGSWLTLKSVALLDSALCNHSVRCHFHHLLKTKELTHHSPVALNKVTVLQWLNTKSLKVSNIEFGVGTKASELYCQYFGSFGSSVRCVHFQNECNELEMMYLVACFCKSICILRCTKVTLSLGFHAILLSNLNIREIWVNGATCLMDDLMKNLSFPMLKLLSVKSMDCMNGFPWSESTSSSSLQYASLSFLSPYSDDLESLIRSCPNLRSFSCKGSDIEDMELEEFVRSRPELINLDISDNGVVTDNAVKFIVQNLPGLRSLNIQWCKQLTINSLSYIAEHCPQLEVLYIDITDTSDSAERIVKTFSQKCLNVTYLNINSSFVMCNTTCTASLLKGCPKLNTLVINRRGNISPTARELCALVKPQLDILVHNKNTEYNVLTMPI